MGKCRRGCPASVGGTGRAGPPPVGLRSFRGGGRDLSVRSSRRAARVGPGAPRARAGAREVRAVGPGGRTLDEDGHPPGRRGGRQSQGPGGPERGRVRCPAGSGVDSAAVYRCCATCCRTRPYSGSEPAGIGRLRGDLRGGRPWGSAAAAGRRAPAGAGWCDTCPPVLERAGGLGWAVGRRRSWTPWRVRGGWSVAPPLARLAGGISSFGRCGQSQGCGLRRWRHLMLREFPGRLANVLISPGTGSGVEVCRSNKGGCVMTTGATDVVVTGLGATTPLGGDVPSTWAAMLAGESGISAIGEEWAAALPVRIAGRLRVEPAEVMDRVQARRLDRCEQVALIAAREAWADAGRPEVEPERLAVVIGTGTGGALSMLGQDDVLEASGVRKVSPHTVPMLMANGPAAWVSIELGARGGAHTPVSACASGAE
ncbi:3-oxoacyl-[acyl-carrier-protein] synthase II, partial [Streptomyces sp. C]